MFCNKCGNQIADGAAFCTACGQPVAGTAQQQPQPAQQPQQTYYQPVNTLDPYTSHFRRTWRTFACGTLAMTLIVLQIASIVLAFADLKTLESSVTGLLAMTGVEYVAAFSTIMSSINGIVVMAMIPNVLLIIGMCMLYADAKDKSDRPIKTSGLKLIKGVNIATVVVFGLVMLGLFLLLQTVTQVIDSASSYYDYFGDYDYYGYNYASKAVVDSLMSTIYVVLALVVGLVVFIYVMTFRLLNGMIKSLESGTPVTTGLGFFMVLYFISGAFSALGLMGPGFTISGALSCAVSFVLGVVLMKYKDMMTKLQADQLQFHANSYQYQ